MSPELELYDKDKYDYLKNEGEDQTPELDGPLRLRITQEPGNKPGYDTIVLLTVNSEPVLTFEAHTNKPVRLGELLYILDQAPFFEIFEMTPEEIQDCKQDIIDAVGAQK